MKLRQRTNDPHQTSQMRGRGTQSHPSRIRRGQRLFSLRPSIGCQACACIRAVAHPLPAPVAPIGCTVPCASSRLTIGTGLVGSRCPGWWRLEQAACDPLQVDVAGRKKHDVTALETMHDTTASQLCLRSRSRRSPGAEQRRSAGDANTVDTRATTRMECMRSKGSATAEIRGCDRSAAVAHPVSWAQLRLLLTPSAIADDICSARRIAHHSRFERPEMRFQLVPAHGKQLQQRRIRVTRGSRCSGGGATMAQQWRALFAPLSAAAPGASRMSASSDACRKGATRVSGNRVHRRLDSAVASAFRSLRHVSVSRRPFLLLRRSCLWSGGRLDGRCGCNRMGVGIVCVFCRRWSGCLVESA